MKLTKKGVSHYTQHTKNLAFFAMLLMIIMSFPSYAFTVGIIVGNTRTMGAASNIEKMCILKNVATSIEKNNQNLKFVFEENDRSARGTVDAANKLIDKHVDLVLLPLISNEAVVAADLLTRAKIPFITTATSNNVIKNPLYGLSTMPSNDEQANLLATYFIKEIHKKIIHIVVDRSNKYSNYIANKFKHDVLTETPSATIIEHSYHSNTINKLGDELPDNSVIFAPLFNPHIASLYTSLVNSGKHFIVIGPDSIGARKEFYDIIPSVSKNVSLRFLKNWNQKLKGPHANDLNAYAKTYCPDNYSSFLSTYSYDLLHLILSIEGKLKITLTGSQIIQVIKESKYSTTMDGIPMDFSKQGFNRKPMYLYEVTSHGNQYLQTLSAQ